MVSTSRLGSSHPFITRTLGLLGALAVASIPTPLLAQQYTLIDGFSRLDVDTSVQATVYNWTIAGIPHLHEISNWYRVGSTGPERSVHTLIVSPGTLKDQNFDGVFETVSVPYADPQGRFAMVIDYAVFSGPASGSSLTGSFDETIYITNLQPSASLPFHFFEYVDLDLYASPDDDTAQMTTPTNVRQFDSLTTGNWGFVGDRYEVDNFTTSSSTLAKLSNPTTDNLANPSSTFPAGSGPFGPGNVSWALQWDFVGAGGPRPAIPPGQTVVITKEGILEMLIPEPASGSMLAFVVVGLGTWRHRRAAATRSRTLRLIGMLTMLFAATCDAQADDLSPPSWTRRTPLTTVQEWEFLQPVPPTTPLPPDGTTPGISPFYNGGGVPLAFVGSGVTWQPQYTVNFPSGPVVMQGVYIGDGSANSYIDFVLPNWVDFEPVKHFRLQVAGLWSPAPLPSTTFLSAIDNQPGNVTAQFVGDGVSPLAVSFEFHRYFDWDLFPNPDSEEFRLIVPPNAVINQVVIDTISIPEPTGLVMIVLGCCTAIAFRNRWMHPDCELREQQSNVIG